MSFSRDTSFVYVVVVVVFFLGEEARNCHFKTYSVIVNSFYKSIACWIEMIKLLFSYTFNVTWVTIFVLLLFTDTILLFRQNHFKTKD